MSWTLDTGTIGAVGVPASELRSFLEAEMAHHAKTTVARAGSDVFLTANADHQKDPNKVAELHDLATEAKSKASAKLPAIQAQMKAGIDAACLLAERIPGNVTCTIAGHTAKNHASGVADRISVYVDSAPHVTDDEED